MFPKNFYVKTKELRTLSEGGVFSRGVHSPGSANATRCYLLCSRNKRFHKRPIHLHCETRLVTSTTQCRAFTSINACFGYTTISIVNKCQKAFILHAGVWSVYKHFCFGYNSSLKPLPEHSAPNSLGAPDFY